MNEYQQQAQAFLEKHGLTFTSEFLKYDIYFSDDRERRNIYTLGLTSTADRRRRYTTRFGASLHITERNEQPTAYDLITCVTKSDPGSFDEFCGEYGYSRDSISALKTYRAVMRDWKKVERFFTAEQIAELQEIN